ncbi:thioredoxin [Natronomonas gomsonensis]|jgi:thioredoxin 1|uniref:thioredoxin n=1 Tax=Natronomonas gomsonensis TaxID=1046043 RepID=UPI0020CA96A1|nr:thioredoxin [Natronomonas gomsonensis]MCY4729420.1 thioredoxin [Natronomonas gomsonensis]
MSDSEDIEDIRAKKREELTAKAGSPSEPVHVNGAGHLEELLEENHVALVDFYADWCGPCKMLEPTVEELAAETNAAVLKVDVDAHQNIAQQYQVQGVPTLYLFVDGEPADRMVGVQEKASLANKIEQHA